MRVNYYVVKLTRLNNFIDNIITDTYYIAKFVIVNSCQLL